MPTQAFAPYPRTFLKTTRSLGIVGAALSLLGRSTQAQTGFTAPEPAFVPAESGYRETDHIRKYYAAARYF